MILNTNQYNLALRSLRLRFMFNDEGYFITTFPPLYLDELSKAAIFHVQAQLAQEGSLLAHRLDNLEILIRQNLKIMLEDKDDGEDLLPHARRLRSLFLLREAAAQAWQGHKLQQKVTEGLLILKLNARVLGHALSGIALNDLPLFDLLNFLGDAQDEGALHLEIIKLLAEDYLTETGDLTATREVEAFAALLQKSELEDPDAFHPLYGQLRVLAQQQEAASLHEFADEFEDEFGEDEDAFLDDEEL